MTKIDQVIIHPTATNPSWYSDKSAKDVLMKLGAGMWMKESGKILATTIVLTDGEIAAGRPIEQSGAQGRESNRN